MWKQSEAKVNAYWKITSIALANVEGPDGANCGVESEEKERCGDVDITKDDCLNEGCCWYTREFEGAPYCFGLYLYKWLFLWTDCI